MAPGTVGGSVGAESGRVPILAEGRWPPAQVPPSMTRSQSVKGQQDLRGGGCKGIVNPYPLWFSILGDAVEA